MVTMGEVALEKIKEVTSPWARGSPQWTPFLLALAAPLSPLFLLYISEFPRGCVPLSPL